MVKDDNAPATKNDIFLFKEEIIRHFDVVSEQLRHYVLGSNRDEVELVKDKQNSHEKRIKNLEKHTGVVTA